jgi:hypothetical protein
VYPRTKWYLGEQEIRPGEREDRAAGGAGRGVGEQLRLDHRSRSPPPPGDETASSAAATAGRSSAAADVQPAEGASMIV